MYILSNKSLKQIVVTTVAGAALLFAGTATASASQKTTVKSGDTLWSISKHYKVSLPSLEKVNHLNDDSILSIGQTIIIPEGKDAKAQSANDNQQQVQTAAVQETTDNSQNNDANVQNTNVNESANTSSNNTVNTASTNDDSSSAKAWIASRESGDSYSASNGQYYGKYQVSASSLNGDYSAANQERVADQYVTSRYGSWDNAKAFWQQHGWY